MSNIHHTIQEAKLEKRLEDETFYKFDGDFSGAKRGLEICELLLSA